MAAFIVLPCQQMAARRRYFSYCHQHPFFFGGSDPYSPSGNATIPFDRAILGEAHLYEGFGIPFDPEGILSSLPAVVTVIIGYLAGMMISETWRIRVPLKLAWFGMVLTATGYLWGLIFPINKPLWTSSVLYTAGLAALLFALLIYIIDVKGIKMEFDVFNLAESFAFALSSV